MPRAFRLGLLWLAATALAVTVSWLGVRLVLFAAVPDRSEPLSAVDLRNASPEPSRSGPSGAGGEKPSASPSPGVVPVTGQPFPDDRGRTTYQNVVPTVGGWATIRWNSSAVTVLDTLASTGYTYEVKRASPTRLEIWFRSAGNTALVVAWWEDGKPMLEVENAVT